MSGFFVLCEEGGIVRETSGALCAVGSPLLSAFAQDSRSKVMQLLVDGRSRVAHTVVQTSSGTVVEAYCAADAGRSLLVAGPTTVEIRRCCDELSTSATTGELALAIGAAARPSELSIDVWAELARVNNELATAHRELARSNAQLRWLSEQKNQLLGMAAHDLRNPLAAVLAYTSFLLEDPLTADQSGMVKRIRANVDTMLAMVEDVLDFTAIESGTVRLDRADLAVESIISDVVEVCGMVAARKEIRIAATVAPETPTVFADRRKITQVLTNLVTNAIKFSHPQSHITVAAGTTEDRGVWISVTDHGVGMTAEQVKKLFQPFEQVGTRPTAGEKSTGLGLAIVGRIVAAHDGRINVESAPGKGSTFTVVLPAAAVREEVLSRVSSEQ